MCSVFTDILHCSSTPVDLSSLGAPPTTLSSAKVLHFTWAPDAFASGVYSSTEQKALMESVRNIPSQFCCVKPPNNGRIGHVWYNLLWDVPHRDRAARTWTEDKPWRIVIGP